MSNINDASWPADYISLFYHTFQSISLNALSKPIFDLTTELFKSQPVFYGYLSCGDRDSNNKSTEIFYKSGYKFANKKLAKAELAIQYLKAHRESIGDSKCTEINSLDDNFLTLIEAAVAPVTVSEDDNKLDGNGDIIISDARTALSALTRNNSNISYIYTAISDICLKGTIKINDDSYSSRYQHLFNQPRAYCENQLAMQLLRKASLVSKPADEFYRKLNGELCFVKGQHCQLEESQHVEFKGNTDPNAYITYEKARLLIQKHASKAICAFLNTAKGGSLYFGIHDNCTVQGILLDKAQRDEIKQSMMDFLCHKFEPCIPTYFSIMLHKVELQPLPIEQYQAAKVEFEANKVGTACAQNGNESAEVKLLKKQIHSLNKIVRMLLSQHASTSEHSNEVEAFVIEFRIIGSPTTHWVDNIAYQRVDNQSRVMTIDALKQRIRDE